jgi:hypothetical protein
MSDGPESLVLRYLRSDRRAADTARGHHGAQVRDHRRTAHGHRGPVHRHRGTAGCAGGMVERHEYYPSCPTEPGVLRTCLRPRIPQQGKLMPDAGLIDDGCLDAGHSRPISETVESQVFQMLHVACDNVHHQVVAPGDQER